MKLELISKRRKESKHNNRFYTALDMAIIKHDIAVKNAEKKRGITPDYPNNIISVCGCGGEGCFIHSSWKTTQTQEEYNKSLADWAKLGWGYTHHKKN